MNHPKASAPPAPRCIHVIFKTHLDVGFTDLAHRVIETYVERFIPQALAMARDLREKHGGPRFVWTTGSWLIHHYLEVVSPARRREMERAINQGDIVWHGLPFTTHTELMDAALFRCGLGLSKELDARFDRKTIAAKMTDVPGHTRAMVPLLKEAGIEFLHIGVNPASKAPAVPNAFRWRHEDKAEVNVIYDKGSYGGLTLIPGCADAIYFAHTGDNLGPCSPEAVEAVFSRLQTQFPHMEVRASTLNDFAMSLRSAAPDLPVVTQELGDTWIHGVGTDPAKVALFRALMRWHAAQPAPATKRGRVALERFARRLLLVPEHTWGCDVKLGLGHEKDYDRRFKTTEFQKARLEPAYKKMERSWSEQRAYLDEAINEMRGTPWLAEVQLIQRSVRPRQPKSSARAIEHHAGKILQTPLFDVGIDPATGAINHLLERATGRCWADPAHLLGALSYEVFSAADYAHLWRHYSQGHAANRDWSIPDFLKPGVESAVDKHRVWSPSLRRITTVSANAQLSIRMELVSAPEPCRLFGCPSEFQIEVVLPNDRPELRFSVQWFGKQASRVPEATWFSLNPLVAKGSGWRMRKLGEWIDPRDVIRDGNRMLHAVEACTYQETLSARTLNIDPVSSALVAPGKTSLVRFSNRLPRTADGLHFNLHNNTWGTNFPLWYEDDARFEFVLSLSPNRL